MCFTYILTNKRNGTLYVGSTTDLIRRMLEHKERRFPGFTCKYGVNMLVYMEVHSSLQEARMRERHIKQWKRLWKVKMIEAQNLEWRDLTEELPNYTLF